MAYGRYKRQTISPVKHLIESHRSARLWAKAAGQSSPSLSENVEALLALLPRTNQTGMGMWNGSVPVSLTPRETA